MGGRGPAKRMSKAVIVAVVAMLLGAAVGAGYSWWGKDAAVPAAIVGTDAHRDAPATRTQPNTGTLAAAVPPANGSSDSTMHDAAASLVGTEAAESLLTIDGVVRHVVMTVDTLPRHQFSAGAWPLRLPSGGFIATSDDQKSPLSENNYARYSPYITVLQKLDVKRLAELYTSHRAAFQQAYEELAPTGAAFDARLRLAIDDMLDSPDVAGPILVERPSGQYVFSDPALEALSSGRKLLLRVGPQNAALIKGKLRELRKALE